MIVIGKKRLLLISACLLLSLGVVGINTIKTEETLPTMALPVTNRTVIIDAGLGEYTLFADTQSYSVQNYLSGILENKGKVTEETYEEEYYYFTNNQKSVSPINIPSELNRGGIKKQYSCQNSHYHSEIKRYF